MGNIGVWELIIIVVLVVFIFGSRKLPELGRGLGLGLANFKRAVGNPDKPQTDNAEVQGVVPPSDKGTDS